MLSREELNHIKRVKEVSYKLNLPEELIELSLHYTSEYIKDKIGSVTYDKSKELTKEDFNNMFPIINLPYIGYLKPSYYKYLNIHKKAQWKKTK